MQADEFNAVLARLFPDSTGKGQSDAARFLEIGGRTVRTYASGDRAVPAPLAKLLRYMVAAGIRPDEVDATIKRSFRRRL